MSVNSEKKKKDATKDWLLSNILFTENKDYVYIPALIVPVFKMTFF